MSSDLKNPYSHETVGEIAKFILSKTTHRPTIAIICGSGLSALGDLLENADVLPYEEIEQFPQSTVHGHKSRFVIGTLSGKSVICMQGRFHFYEGYSMHKVTMAIRVFHLMGVTHLIVTNAAGGLNPAFKIGDIMAITDHIFLPGMVGNNPLMGPNDPRFGERFVPVSNIYTPDLYNLVKESAAEANVTGVQEGCYVMVSGPSYESSAESRFLRFVGADAVGMSTLPEAIVAHHCGMKVVAMSLITNIVVVDPKTQAPANHEEVLEAGKLREIDFQKIVKLIVSKLP